MKKISLLLSITFSLFSSQLFAWTDITNVETGSSFYNNMPLYLLGAATALVFIWAITTIIQLFNSFVKMAELKIYKEQGLEEYIKEKEANEVSWWQKFSRKISDVVPIDQEEDILFDHEYDGIRELDNNLPPWWLYGFYLSIVVSVIYIGVFHFSSYAMSSQEIYALEMKEAELQVEEFLSRQANKVSESTVTLLTDAQSLGEGKSIFNLNCATCHLESGGSMPGGVGPNLTDKYWMHGGGIKDVFKTIKYGVPEKGMISWKAQMRPSDMHKVASYILSLQGTNPPNPKEPQGELYEPTEEEE